jgi:hypothetical protein
MTRRINWLSVRSSVAACRLASSWSPVGKRTATFTMSSSPGLFGMANLPQLGVITYLKLQRGYSTVVDTRWRSGAQLFEIRSLPAASRTGARSITHRGPHGCLALMPSPGGSKRTKAPLSKGVAGCLQTAPWGFESLPGHKKRGPFRVPSLVTAMSQLGSGGSHRVPALARSGLQLRLPSDLFIIARSRPYLKPMVPTLVGRDVQGRNSRLRGTDPSALSGSRAVRPGVPSEP